MQSQCKICLNSFGNETFVVREMMFGTREEFVYLRCSSCGCVQIMEPPDEMSRFYPNNYYSFNNNINKNNRFRWLKNIIKYWLINIFMSKNSVFPLNKISYIRNFGWVNIIKALKKTVCILDVGCGSGYLLQEMNVLGYKNLTGIDAFIKNDISICKGKVKIFRQDIFHHTTMYDLIMCHHSFEHMDNPRSVLEQLYKMLNQNGFLLIRIPVADSFAFRKYGSNWFQLDAPRHFFLYTTKSITILGKSAGFVLKQIVYDSTESQFLESEKYRRGISLFEKEYFPSGYLQECKKQALLLNQIMDGDQACFLFQKTN